jgi:hypothetical protein
VNFQAETETPLKQERFELPTVVLLRDKKPQRIANHWGVTIVKQMDLTEREGQVNKKSSCLQLENPQSAHPIRPPIPVNHGEDIANNYCQGYGIDRYDMQMPAPRALSVRLRARSPLPRAHTHAQTQTQTDGREHE